MARGYELGQAALVVSALLLPPATGVAWGSADQAPGAAIERFGREIEAGRLDAAEEALGELAAGDVPEAAFRLGRARVLARQYAGAEPLLRRALEGGRDEPSTRLFYSAALWENGRPEEAEVVLRAALATGGPSVRHQLARLLLWKGYPEEAAELLESLAAAFGSRLDLQLDRARALEGVALATGTGWREVVEAYERCRRLAAEHYEIRYGLARALPRVGRREDALREMEAYRRLLAEDTERTREKGRESARIDLALRKWAAGEVESALAALREMPASVDALAALARIEAERGGREAAVGALERAVTLAPERSDLRLRLEELMAAGDVP